MWTLLAQLTTGPSREEAALVTSSDIITAITGPLYAAIPIMLSTVVSIGLIFWVFRKVTTAAGLQVEIVRDKIRARYDGDFAQDILDDEDDEAREQAAALLGKIDRAEQAFMDSRHEGRSKRSSDDDDWG